MRHGRKSASRGFDGHKLDVVSDEASELVLDVGVRAGNAADGDAAPPSDASTTCSTLSSATMGRRSTRWSGRWPTATGTCAKRSRLPALRWSPRFRWRPTAAGFPRPTSFSTSTPTCRRRPVRRVRPPRPGRTPVPARDAQPSSSCSPRPPCAVCPLREQCVRGRGGHRMQVSVHESASPPARALRPTTRRPSRCCARAKVERKIDHIQPRHAQGSLPRQT